MSAARSLVYGPEAVKAAESLRRQRGKDESWPYNWVYAPPGSKMDQAVDYVAVPAVGTPTLVVSYTVADGLQFYPTGIVLQLLGANSLPGDFTWSLTVNSPVGVNAPQSLPYDGFQTVPVGLGTLEIPWDFPRAERNRLNSRDVLRIVVKNVNLGVGGASFVGVIKGYLF